MAVSQRQIAEKLGVSIALVSRVLSGKAQEVGIAAATIEKVLVAAAELGYVPSAAALTLKGKSSRTIGVVVYDFQDPFFGPIIEQLQALAHEQGYSLVLTGFKSRHPEPSDLAPLHKHAIDGLIILGSDEQADWFTGFRDLPVARIGHGRPAEQSLRVAIDEVDAAQQLVRFLNREGLQHFIFVGQDLPAQRLRLAALTEAVVGGGSVPDKIFCSGDAFQAGLKSVQAALLQTDRPDAFICANDKVAMGALHALHESGHRIAVTGFDDIPAAAQFIPPITTIQQPIEKMARHAFMAVIEPGAPAEVLLKGKLIIRSST